MIKNFIKRTQQKVEKFVKKRNSPVLAKLYFSSIEMMKPFYFTQEFLLSTGLRRKKNGDYIRILNKKGAKGRSRITQRYKGGIYAKEKNGIYKPIHKRAERGWVQTVGRIKRPNPRI